MSNRYKSHYSYERQAYGMRNPNYVHRILDNYCVLDTETTGLSAYYDEIIEIGILREKTML